MSENLFNNPYGSRGQTKVDITFNELYALVREKLDYFHPDHSDPDAFCQDLGCRIEKKMGIFPNVPGPHTSED